MQDFTSNPRPKLIPPGRRGHRVIILAICAAFVFAAMGVCYAVATMATVATAMIAGVIGEFVVAISTITLVLMLPVLIALAWLFFTAEWFTCIRLPRELLGFLGWS
jgi:hypothetical protein